MFIVAGVGPGNPKYLTVEVKEEIQKANRIVAFGRAAKTAKVLGKNVIEVTAVADVLKEIIKEDTLLLASGDSCFYGIVDYLKRNSIKIDRVLPGISSFQYLCAKLQISWQDALMLSLHGKEEDLYKCISSKKTILLLDKENSPSKVEKELVKLGLKGTMHIGYSLSYEDEEILSVAIGSGVTDNNKISLMVIENEMA